MWPSEPWETFDHAGMVCELWQDECHHNDGPRDWDNATEMVCWHRSYSLGDRQPDNREIDALERGGMALLERYLRMTRGIYAFAPLGLIDHSGLSMYVGGGDHWCDPGGWDSGTVGFIFVPKDNVCGTTEEYAKEVIEQDVNVYDAFLRGEVAGYIVRDPDDEIDSEGCWGFYPDAGRDPWEYLRSEARSIAESMKEDKDEKRAWEKKERAWAADRDIATKGAA